MIDRTYLNRKVKSTPFVPIKALVIRNNNMNQE